MNSIEVCLSPALFDFFKNKDSVVVVVDVLRATTSICVAFSNGVKNIIPVASEEEALKLKKEGYVVAAERNGIPLDFADFGNSPYNFSSENVKEKSIVFTTTNGTKTIKLASDCYKVYIGAFVNFSALCNSLISDSKDVVILCAGWKNKVNVEDSVFAGAVVEKLLNSGKFNTICDSALIVKDMWQNNCNNLDVYIQKTAQYSRLKKNLIHDSIPFCLSLDKTDKVPYYNGVSLVV